MVWQSPCRKLNKVWQIGRMIALLALGLYVGGVTVNRYCASGLETIAIASAKIQAGLADCIIAGGVESMSLVPMIGWRTVSITRSLKNMPIGTGTWD